MTTNGGEPGAAEPESGERPPPLLIATILGPEGNTGVHTHFRQLRAYLADLGEPTTLITPFSWGGPLATPVFGARLALARCSRPAGVAWYRFWHEVFLHQALRRALARAGKCVIYAQCPLSARAALAARQGPWQRVVMAVHFRVSQADEWAGKGEISRDGQMFRAIRRLERDVIPRTDGLMYVSEWARTALTRWLPEAARVPSVVIGNFVRAAPAARAEQAGEPLADLVTVGHLEPVKNHRYLLEVLAEAARAGHRLTLDIYGEGPLRRDLLRRAEELDVSGLIRLRGFAPDVRRRLPRYRAYVHVSYSESSSLAIIEAMAAGLPIVAANIGPIAELCDDGAEARFWPLDEPAMAARILTALLNSEADLRKAAGAARERFRREFDADVIAPRLLSFLTSHLQLWHESAKWAAPTQRLRRQ